MIRFAVRLAVVLIPLMAGMVAAGGAQAASITVGLDGGAPMAVPPALAADANPAQTRSIDLYLDLPGAEVASVFDAEFDIATSGDWTWSLDLTRVDPGESPFGVGTWDAAGNQVPSQAGVTLLSDNLGGVRLVAQLIVTRNSSTGSDFFEVSLGDGAVVSKDTNDFPFSMDVPLSTATGQTLAVLTPEPGTGLLFGGALAGLAGLRRRRML